MSATIAIGDGMFWGCKILILPKSNHFCPKNFC